MVKYYIPFEAQLEEKVVKEGVKIPRLKIKGKVVDTSINANRWQVTEEGLNLIAEEIKGIPLLTDHNVSVYNVVGRK
jgi:hypothetical protein